MGGKFEVPASSYLWPPIFQKSRFLLVPDWPIGFRGKWAVNSKSPHQITYGQPFFENLDFYWFRRTNGILRTTGLRLVLHYANKWSFTLPFQVLLVSVYRIFIRYTLFVENVSLFHSSVSSIELDANSIFAVRVRVELELWSLNSTRTRSFEFELDRARVLKAWTRLELEVLEFELDRTRA